MILDSLLEKKKEIAIGFASVIAGVVILIGYFQSGPDATSFAKVEMAYRKWEAKPQDIGLYQSMRLAMAKLPTLEKKYEAQIAQALLNSERTKEALILARRSLDRLKNEAPLHAQYAETSLIIEEGKYQKALEKAVALKEQIARSFHPRETRGKRLVGGAILYAHNLLRIAFLQKELKNRPGERAAWEELESFFAEEKPVSIVIEPTFEEKELGLSDYISERKKQI
jgi:hypothetical protein